jgi:ribosomal protein L12E/L44/L45/RPP1/RPP2
MRTSRKSPKKKAEIEFKKLVRELCSPRAAPVRSEPVRQEPVRQEASKRMILAEIEKRRIREAVEEARRNPVEDPFAAVRARAREQARREIESRADEEDARLAREMGERIKERRAARE